MPLHNRFEHKFTSSTQIGNETELPSKTNHKATKQIHDPCQAMRFKETKSLSTGEKENQDMPHPYLGPTHFPSLRREPKQTVYTKAEKPPQKTP